MDPIEAAITQLIESKTAAEEKRAAERLNALVRQKRAPFELTLHDAASGEVIPLSQRAADLQRAIDVSLGSGGKTSREALRWTPKDRANIDLLLRE